MMREGLTLITTLLHSPRVLGRQWVGDTLKPLGLALLGGAQRHQSYFPVGCFYLSLYFKTLKVSGFLRIFIVRLISKCVESEN